MGDKKRLLYFGEPPRVLLGFFRGVCNFLSSILSQQKFEGMDIKALGSSQLSDRLSHNFQTDCLSSRKDRCYSSWTDQCYSFVLFRK